MVVEVAKLSMTADTTGLKSAIPVLDNLVAAGKRAQTTSAQLRAEIAQTDAALKALKASGNASKTEIDSLGSALTGLRVKLASSKAESMGLANEMHAMKSASSVAGHSVGNLTAQLFDIGVMMQQGQNPFVLMVQQGSQIAQVMGSMGAGGAMAALKASIVQLINPMNLAIFAVVGITAAVVPMIASFLTGGEEAKSLGDSMGDLAKRVDAYVSAVDKVQMSSSKMIETYGKESDSIRKLLLDMAKLEERKTLAAQRAAADSVKLEAGISNNADSAVGSQKNLADMFDLSIWSSEARSHINDVIAAFDELNNAGTLEEQLAVAEQLRAKFEELAMGSGNVSDAEAAILEPLGQIILELTKAVDAQDDLSISAEETERRAELVRAKAAEINNTIASADGSALQQAFASAFPAANQLLGIANAIRSALSLGNAIKSLNTQGLASQYASYGAGRKAFEDAAKASGSLYTPYDYPKVEDFGGSAPPGRPMDLGVPESSGGGSGGGGGGGGGRSDAAKEAEKQAEAIKKVNESLQSEIELVGASDEARRLHQELQKAGVTIYSEEGQKIAELVNKLTELEQKQKLVAETMKGIENAAQGFFVGVLSGAKDLGSAIADLLRQLGNLFLNQAFKMLWEGKGGTGGIGGWLAGLFDAGGNIPAGQVGVVAEKRPEFVNGKLVNRPTLVSGPAQVTGGYASANILDRAMKSVPSMNNSRRYGQSQPAPQISLHAPPVVVLDDPRKIDDYNRSLRGERAYARNRRRLTNA